MHRCQHARSPCDAAEQSSKSAASSHDVLRLAAPTVSSHGAGEIALSHRSRLSERPVKGDVWGAAATSIPIGRVCLAKAGARQASAQKEGSRRERQVEGSPRLESLAAEAARGSDPRVSGSGARFPLQRRLPKETAALQPDLMSRRHPLIVDLSFQSALERSNETESHVTLPILMLSARADRSVRQFSKRKLLPLGLTLLRLGLLRGLLRLLRLLRHVTLRK